MTVQPLAGSNLGFYNQGTISLTLTAVANQEEKDMVKAFFSLVLSLVTCQQVCVGV